MSFCHRVFLLSFLLGGASAATLAFASGADETSAALQVRAIRLYQENRLSEALPLYRQLAQRLPNDSVILKNLMWILWKSGDAKGTAGIVAYQSRFLS